MTDETTDDKRRSPAAGLRVGIGTDVHAFAPLALGKPAVSDYVAALAKLGPIADLLPRRPQIAERTTGSRSPALTWSRL